MSPSRRTVRIVPRGPMLIQGPVEVELEDGTRVCSDRFMVAICCCQRSKTYPWCDTSHRRQNRSAADGRKSGADQAQPT
ncbi:CDGSH iron-sulfur domain-containing protein [Mycolicibacterium mucogenicum]|nr:CDGSH iron-sulfur domain-containing protein [Mycolicibacterium mucogenicum]